MVRRKAVVLPPIASKPTVKEWRVGRNFIRVGDVVKITGTVITDRYGKEIRKRDGFRAKVTEIRTDDAGEVCEVEVRGGRNNATRTFRPDRIVRIAQSTVEEK